MSDTSVGPHPGTLSPRNIDTVTYRVERELPRPNLPKVGETFSSWPQGEVFACVSGLGLGVIKNSEIEDWEKVGLIDRVTKAAPPTRKAAASGEGDGERA